MYENLMLKQYIPNGKMLKYECLNTVTCASAMRVSEGEVGSGGASGGPGEL